MFDAWDRALPGGIRETHGEEHGGGWGDEWDLGGWGGCGDLPDLASIARWVELRG